MPEQESRKLRVLGWATALSAMINLGASALLLVACNTQYPVSCPAYTPFDLSGADTFPANDNLPFQFPLENYDPGKLNYKSSFVMSGRSNFSFPIEYHAAEDSYDPPGTPVYAMADGRVSFSGRAGGYGWLIIINHPQANLYSLYGHLSPSRWKLEIGTDVKKGDLIASLGDPHENGGSTDSPLVPHLHFGIRAGQMNDYPGKGEWRFMAGWVSLCPQDLGWLQPSLVITRQEIPTGGYPQPKVAFLTRWGMEPLFTGVYGIGAAVMLVIGIRKKSWFSLMFLGPILTIAGIILFKEHVVSTYTLLGIGVIVTVIAITLFMRQPKSNSPDQG